MIDKESAALVYNNIGDGYNYTRKADSHITARLLDYLSANVNGNYLDIGSGTGNYTIRFSENGLSLWGIDPSSKMLEQAIVKSDKVKWLQGTAEKIPVQDQMFAGAIATLTVHHWGNIEKSFNELFRVLKKDSKLVFFTSTPEQMEGYWLNHYFSEMLRVSIDKMPSLKTLEIAGSKAGFHLMESEKYFIDGNLKDWFLYSGKHNPEVYFESRVRSGISSFATLASKEKLLLDLSNFERI